MCSHAQVFEVQQVVQRLTGAWRGGPAVSVVATPADLPVTDAPADARGLYFQNRVWVVASTQPTRAVADVINHEAVAHFGLRRLYGPAWAGFMNAIRGGVRAGDTELVEMRNHVRRAYAQDDGQFALSPIQEADEIAAAASENWTRYESGLIETRSPIVKQMKAAWGFFARERLYVDFPATGEQLQGALLAAQHRLRHGGPCFGIVGRLGRWYAWLMPTPDRYQRPMSLTESTHLLKSENDRLARKNAGLEEIFSGGILLVILAVFVLLGAVGYFFELTVTLAGFALVVLIAAALRYLKVIG